MPIIPKLKNVARKAKDYVQEHKQPILNTVMLVGLSGVSAAVLYLTRENRLLAENEYMLMQRQDYTRERIYDVERNVGMPVHSDDQRYHDHLESKKAESPQ